jgi:hypothetical protein
MAPSQGSTSLVIWYGNNEIYCINNAGLMKVGNAIVLQRTGKKVRLPRVGHHLQRRLNNCLSNVLIELTVWGIRKLYLLGIARLT